MRYTSKDEKLFLSKNKLDNPRHILNNNAIVTRSMNNFHSNKKHNNDIMGRITNILNDKDDKENYESCYLGNYNKILQSISISSPANSAGKHLK